MPLSHLPDKLIVYSPASSTVDSSGTLDFPSIYCSPPSLELYFVFIVGGAESELDILDLIQAQSALSKDVCELDLVFYFDKKLYKVVLSLKPIEMKSVTLSQMIWLSDIKEYFFFKASFEGQKELTLSLGSKALLHILLDVKCPGAWLPLSF
ncbi:hypothetical protein BDR04DRAFT_1118915 [Suillus decipiens]|nr:hypothetical protein BDR04DRAFT_1118915 [Suillus decipiens]